jgi:glycerol-3-phosphate dehydrogenase
LPGVDLPPTVVATADPGAVRDAVDLVIFAAPSAHLRVTVAEMRPHLAPSADLLSS